MKILLIVLIALATMPAAFAQHPFWLEEAIRVNNPDELAYWISVETDCPLTEGEIESVIEDVLTERRIKPVRHKIFEDGRIYLNLRLRCTRIVADNKHAFSLSIHFGRYKPWPAILFDAPYGEFGVASKDTISRHCKERLEAAVAAFKRANALTVGQRQKPVQG